MIWNIWGKIKNLIDNPFCKLGFVLVIILPRIRISFSSHLDCRAMLSPWCKIARTAFHSFLYPSYRAPDPIIWRMFTVRCARSSSCPLYTFYFSLLPFHYFPQSFFLAHLHLTHAPPTGGKKHRWPGQGAPSSPHPTTSGVFITTHLYMSVFFAALPTPARSPSLMLIFIPVSS